MHDLDLACVRLVVDAGAAPRHLGRVDAGADGDERGRDGGVGDAHLTCEQRLVARGDEVARGLDAHLDGAQRLLAGEGRALRHVGGAGPYLAGQQTRGGGEFTGDADVDDAHLGADLIGEGVADGPAAEEVGDHLARDLLRPGRDALGVDAVVAREDRDGGRLGQRRRALARQTAQLRGDDLQHAERAGRLGHALLALPRLTERLRVQRTDGRDGVGEQVLRLGARQHTASVRLLVHDPRQRAALGPARLRELRLGRELVDVPDTQVRDHFEVLGQFEGADHLALVEEADPADAEALRPRGEPQVLHGERRGVGRHLRLGVPSEGVPAAAGRIGGDHDVDGGVEDGLDLQFLELLRAALRQGLGVGVALTLGHLVHGTAGVLGADDHEVPGLGVSDARRRVGRLEDAEQHVVRDRVGAEAVADVAALAHQPVHGLALVVGEPGCGRAGGCLLGGVGPGRVRLWARGRLVPFGGLGVGYADGTVLADRRDRGGRYGRGGALGFGVPGPGPGLLLGCCLCGRVGLRIHVLSLSGDHRGGLGHAGLGSRCVEGVDGRLVLLLLSGDPGHGVRAGSCRVRTGAGARCGRVLGTVGRDLVLRDLRLTVLRSGRGGLLSVLLRGDLRRVRRCRHVGRLRVHCFRQGCGVFRGDGRRLLADRLDRGDVLSGGLVLRRGRFLSGGFRLCRSGRLGGAFALTCGRHRGRGSFSALRRDRLHRGRTGLGDPRVARALRGLVLGGARLLGVAAGLAAPASASGGDRPGRLLSLGLSRRLRLDLGLGVSPRRLRHVPRIRCGRGDLGALVGDGDGGRIRDGSRFLCGRGELGTREVRGVLGGLGRRPLAVLGRQRSELRSGQRPGVLVGDLEVLGATGLRTLRRREVTMRGGVLAVRRGGLRRLRRHLGGLGLRGALLRGPGLLRGHGGGTVRRGGLGGAVRVADASVGERTHRARLLGLRRAEVQRTARRGGGGPLASAGLRRGGGRRLLALGGGRAYGSHVDGAGVPAVRLVRPRDRRARRRELLGTRGLLLLRLRVLAVRGLLGVGIVGVLRRLLRVGVLLGVGLRVGVGLDVRLGVGVPVGLYVRLGPVHPRLCVRVLLLHVAPRALGARQEHLLLARVHGAVDACGAVRGSVGVRGGCRDALLLGFRLPARILRLPLTGDPGVSHAYPSPIGSASSNPAIGRRAPVDEERACARCGTFLRLRAIRTLTDEPSTPHSGTTIRQPTRARGPRLPRVGEKEHFALVRHVLGTVVQIRTPDNRKTTARSLSTHSRVSSSTDWSRAHSTA